jgi:hypothetical protein
VTSLRDLLSHAAARATDHREEEAECWMGATIWRGQRLMRISVSSWRTTEADVDRSIAAIAEAASRGAGGT